MSRQYGGGGGGGYLGGSDRGGGYAAGSRSRSLGRGPPPKDEDDSDDEIAAYLAGLKQSSTKKKEEEQQFNGESPQRQGRTSKKEKEPANEKPTTATAATKASAARGGGSGGGSRWSSNKYADDFEDVSSEIGTQELLDMSGLTDSDAATPPAMARTKLATAPSVGAGGSYAANYRASKLANGSPVDNSAYGLDDGAEEGGGRTCDDDDGSLSLSDHDGFEDGTETEAEAQRRREEEYENSESSDGSVAKPIIMDFADLPGSDSSSIASKSMRTDDHASVDDSISSRGAAGNIMDFAALLSESDGGAAASNYNYSDSFENEDDDDDDDDENDGSRSRGAAGNITDVGSGGGGKKGANTYSESFESSENSPSTSSGGRGGLANMLDIGDLLSSSDGEDGSDAVGPLGNGPGARDGPHGGGSGGGDLNQTNISVFSIDSLEADGSGSGSGSGSGRESDGGNGGRLFKSDAFDNFDPSARQAAKARKLQKTAEVVDGGSSNVDVTLSAPAYPTHAEAAGTAAANLPRPGGASNGAAEQRPTAALPGPHVGTAAVMAGAAPAGSQPAPLHPFHVQTTLADRVGPAPIARFAMDPDTIALLERYDPGVLAMTDLLRHQLDFTQHFMEGQRRLAKASCTEASQTGFKYTTLQDTKDEISRHKAVHPIMSLEEALAQVAREEDADHFWKDA